MPLLPSNPPKTPLCRIINDGMVGLCPECGSSIMRKYYFFGKKYCLQPDCPSNYELDWIEKIVGKRVE